MTEQGFIQLLKTEGYLAEGQSMITQEQVTEECEKILAKKSSLPAGAREIFMSIKNIMLLRVSENDKSLRLPHFVYDPPVEKEAPVAVSE